MGRRRMKNYNPMAIAESPMTAPDSRDSVAEQLRALLALAERATPGEWRAEEENADYSGGGQWYDLRVGDRNPFWYPYNGPGSDGSREKANADFVVAAVNFIRTHGPEVLQALARGPQQAGGEDGPPFAIVSGEVFYGPQDLCLAYSEAKRDAARYRWLRERLDSVDFAYGEPARTVLTFAWPDGVRVGANLDKNIDAARLVRDGDSGEG